MGWLNFFIILLIPLLVSCQSARVPQTKTESQEEAISAIHSVAEALSTTEAAVVKYCPIDGKHFAPHLKMCPEHNVLLEEMKE